MRHPVYKESRARDPRRERPHFHAGSFWTYTDPSRRHHVCRIAVWRTSFGEATDWMLNWLETSLIMASRS